VSDQNNFLSRWSKRKRTPETDKAEPEQKQASLPAAIGKDAAAPSAAEAEFDITTLPSLDSITANSDIRAFLQRGVPAILTRAALRRAWSADPAIRDFVGLSENSWDFNNPDSIPGFGTLNAQPVQEAAVRFFSQPKGETNAPPAPETGGERAEIPSEASPAAESDSKPDASPGPDAQQVRDAASQHDDRDEPEDLSVPRRRHGGALPG